MKHEFDTQLLITVAGVEEEYDLHVVGEYHRAEGAFTYPGEMAPTDPPEPALFEWSEMTIEYGGKPLNVRSFMSTKQVDAIEDKGLQDAQENL